MEANEQQFKTGFNNGYLLAKHEPVLLNKIALNLEPVNDYVSGLISGKKEYEIEIEKSKIEDLGQLRDTSKGRHKDIER